MMAASIYAIQGASGNNAVVKIMLIVDRHGLTKMEEKERQKGQCKA